MRKDVVSGLFLLVIAAAYYAGATRIQMSTLADDFGPAGLPTVLAAMLAVVGLVLVGRGLFVVDPSPKAPTGDEEAEASPTRAVGLLLIGAAYVAIVPILGFVVSIALLLAAIAAYEGAALSWRLVAVSVAGAAFFWLLFVKVLRVPQPAGLFF